MFKLYVQNAIRSQNFQPKNVNCKSCCRSCCCSFAGLFPQYFVSLLLLAIIFAPFNVSNYETKLENYNTSHTHLACTILIFMHIVPLASNNFHIVRNANAEEKKTCIEKCIYQSVFLLAASNCVVCTRLGTVVVHQLPLHVYKNHSFASLQSVVEISVSDLNGYITSGLLLAIFILCIVLPAECSTSAWHTVWLLLVA